MRISHSLAAALFVSAVLIAPDIASAAGGAVPSGGGGGGGSDTGQRTFGGSPKNSHVKKKTPNGKSSSLEDFIIGYEAAYALIYDKGDYEAGITALRALDRDDNPDVATLLGYASRKLGRYDDAKAWYERALAADPNHALTWSYYGMWQAEQGNVLKAMDNLEKVRLICGTDCRSYRMLKETIDGTATY
jgi:tetratricopeptide (TPR) repeat protein